MGVRYESAIVLGQLTNWALRLGDVPKFTIEEPDGRQWMCRLAWGTSTPDPLVMLGKVVSVTGALDYDAGEILVNKITVRYEINPANWHRPKRPELEPDHPELPSGDN